MPLKRQFIHLKEMKKLAKQKKFEVKSDILIEDTSILLKNESTKSLLVPEKDTPQYRDLDWEKNSDSKDNLEMIDDNKNILDINAFTKLIRAA